MSIDYSKIILKALAENRRRQIIATHYNPQTADLYTDAFVYAVAHSVCPIFEEYPGYRTERADILEVLPFHETYEAGYALVKQIYDLLDKAQLNKEKITFYDVESPYRLSGEHWAGLDIRGDLINICRYFFLSDSFDKEFWTAFMSSAPVEASGITEKWSRDELASAAQLIGAAR
jgi:antitoxin MazE